MLQATPEGSSWRGPGLTYVHVRLDDAWLPELFSGTPELLELQQLLVLLAFVDRRLWLSPGAGGGLNSKLPFGWQTRSTKDLDHPPVRVFQEELAGLGVGDPQCQAAILPASSVL